jgi:hypothetical protein
MLQSVDGVRFKNTIDMVIYQNLIIGSELQIDEVFESANRRGIRIRQSAGHSNPPFSEAFEWVSRLPKI